MFLVGLVLRVPAKGNPVLNVPLQENQLLLTDHHHVLELDAPNFTRFLAHPLLITH